MASTGWRTRPQSTAPLIGLAADRRAPLLHQLDSVREQRMACPAVERHRDIVINDRHQLIDRRATARRQRRHHLSLAPKAMGDYAGDLSLGVGYHGAMPGRKRSHRQ